VFPLLLLLVLQREVVAHDNKITIILSVLEGYTEDVSKDIKTGSLLALRVNTLHSCGVVEEFEEVHGLDDATNSFLLHRLISSKVAHVSAADHALDQEFVVGLHTARKGIADLFLVANKRAGIDDGESPEAKVLQGVNSISNRIVCSQAYVVEAGNNRAESSETIGSTNEGVAVLHAKALLEDCAVTVRVNLKFHRN